MLCDKEVEKVANIMQGQGQMKKPMVSGGTASRGMGASRMNDPMNSGSTEPKKAKKWLWWLIGVLGLLVVIALIWILVS